MDIGQRIKEKRTLLMLTQEELANRCELTKGYISQLENDKVSPSIETLETILDVLGISFSEFFDDKRKKKIIFNAEEQYIKEFGGYTQTWLVPTSQELSMEPIIIKIDPKSETFHDYPHPGEEFGYVVKGEITVCYGGERHKCKALESFYFKSDQDHYLINETDSVVEIIWVSCPPNF